MIKFEIEVFLHSHFETGNPCEIDFLGITNVYKGRVPIGDLQSIIDESMEYELEKFAEMKTEECYTVVGELKFETGDIRGEQACWFELLEIREVNENKS